MRAQRAAPLPVARKNWPHAPKASCRPRHPQQPRRLANPQQERRIGRAGFRQPAAAAGHAGGLTSLACTEGVIGSRSRTRDVPTLRAANRSGHEEGLQAEMEANGCSPTPSQEPTKPKSATPGEDPGLSGCSVFPVPLYPVNQGRRKRRTRFE